MSFTRARRMIGILILLISLALLCWGLWPFGKLSQSIQLSPSEMQIPPPGSFMQPGGSATALWIADSPGMTHPG